MAGNEIPRILLIALWVLASTLAVARADEPAKHADMKCSPSPLLQPGKAQLVERVLVRPGARLAPSADGIATTAVPAMSALYLYDRSPDGKSVQVGARSDCHPDGWLAADHVVSWRHAITVQFTERTNRGRVLFFRDDASLRQLIHSPDAGDQARKLAAGQKSDALAAIEPETSVDFNSQFYLLPVLDAQGETIASSDAPPKQVTRLLHVAAISLRGEGAAAAAAGPPNAPPGLDVRRNFRTGVVFLVDATTSTQPYIDQMRAAIDEFYGEIEKANLQDRVRFGLIGYRDDPQKVRGIEYQTRTFVDLNKVDNRQDFDKAASALVASRISSQAEAEDGFAALAEAIENTNWGDFSARFVVLITDASSRKPGPLAKTKYDEFGIKKLADAKDPGVKIIAIHLLTPQGSAQDHAAGAKEYTALTAQPDGRSLYIPIQAGNLDVFKREIGQAAHQFATFVQETEAAGPSHPSPTQPAPPPQSVDEEILAIGHAMRLAYLGRINGSAVPPMFDAWTVDRDYSQRSIPSLLPGVLLNRAQLSDLAKTVTVLADAFNHSKGDEAALYRNLRAGALTLHRDPSRIGTSDSKTLSAALLGEYLDDLPYKSDVAAMNEDDWSHQQSGEKQSFIDHLLQRGALYQSIYDDPKNWTKLAVGADDADAVHFVKLIDLP